MDTTTSTTPTATVQARSTVRAAAIVAVAGTASVAATALATWAPLVARVSSNHNETLVRGTGE